MRRPFWILALVLAAVLDPRVGSGELRDPTRPPRPTTRAVETPRGGASKPGVRLEAVWITPERRLARINGRDVEEGDTFFGATVARIEAAAVTLVQGGQPRVLTFTQTVLIPAEDQP